MSAVPPFADKPLHLPISITLICGADAPAAAREAVLDVPTGELDTEKITSEIIGDRLYVNWTPGGDHRRSTLDAGRHIRDSAVAVGKYLEAEGCGNGYFQLESGEGMTLPPRR